MTISNSLSAPTTQAAPSKPHLKQVISKLHAWLPSPRSPSSLGSPHPNVPAVQSLKLPVSSSAAAPEGKRTTQARCLKVRILTWNMHDSLPKGSLEELLGKVPPYSEPLFTSAGFPMLSDDDSHPYHLVVVAGQECPSLSGIPMGIGAGFKLIDKENHKPRERDPESEKAKSKHRSKEDDEAAKAQKTSESDATQNPPTGWTSLTEDWLCHGGGHTPGEITPVQEAIRIPTPSKATRNGPYTLLVKERLMGIYLAVYIHRDLRTLVRGTSKDAVTSGLIGGRVGNKGGVGITLNIDGITILLLNAHLAAHEGKLHHRLANLTKIKTELSVDDFLVADDPRIMAEDLTDKFDYTFIFGDLNFRLDISRLHADWLISRQDYAQALAFDQLYNLMNSGMAFVGFHEAPIDFPPTFKYDVLRTLKQSKSKEAAPKLGVRSHTTGAVPMVSEVEEITQEHLDEDDGEGDEEGIERTSINSSAFTSTHSRATIDVDDDDRSPLSASASTPAIPVSPLTRGFSSPGSRVSLNIHKAKAKWLSLLSSPRTPLHWIQYGSRHTPTTTPGQDPQATSTSLPYGPIEIVEDQGGKTMIVPRPDAVIPSSVDPSHLQAPALLRSKSTKGNLLPSLNTPDGDMDQDRGVYDSSHKKRVPSWCDRILWKSTVKPDLEIEDPEPTTRSRTRMGHWQFLFNTFLKRRISVSSIASSSSQIGHSSTSSTAPMDRDAYRAPQSPFVTQVPPRQCLSEESLPLSQDKRKKPSLWSSENGSGNIPFRRSRSIAATTPESPRQGLHRPVRRVSVPVGPYDAVGRTTLRTPSNAPLPAAIGTVKTASLQPLSRWRFLPFLNSGRDSAPLLAVDTPAATPLTGTPRPRRGDVVCMSYRTLDDKDMRRLEGRSDHRPVIGSYRIYM